MTAKLTAVPQTVFQDDRDDVVVLKAPGKQKGEHPILGPLPVAMKWMMNCRQLMQGQDMSLYEADQIVTRTKSHDGKGRRFQPAGQR